jgi:hypothetical protein
MPQLGPITMWVISTTRTPVSGKSCVVIGVSLASGPLFGRRNAASER